MTPVSSPLAATYLQQGHLVALPTETVYGLAANALDPLACQKIFQVKGRPLIDPLIVHVLDASQASTIALIPPQALSLINHFWPGPLTLVLPKKSIVPDLVTAGKPSVAVRSPSHPTFREILQLAQIPLAAPSANPFGYLSPTHPDHVIKNLGSRISYYVDAGPTQWGIESTILDLTNPQNPTVLRFGPITPDQIQSVLNSPISTKTHSISESAPLDAPGLLKSHYSPHTPLHFLLQHPATIASQFPSQNIALVFLSKPHNLQDLLASLPPTYQIYWLSENGDLNQVAKNVFHLLHSLDLLNFHHIFIEKSPNSGLGLAINERLQKATYRHSLPHPTQS